MDWTRGFTASYYAMTVDSATWRDLERIDITGGSVKREREGLRASADVDCLNYDGGERWIRIYLDAKQDGDNAHVPLFTGLATSPEVTYEGRRMETELECYSVLKPAEDILLTRGWYAVAGSNGANVVRRLLSVTPAPVVVTPNSPTLSQAIIAEDGETHLSMIDKILTAINWRLRITGNGVISVEPEPIEEVASFDPLENDVIETTIKKSSDWYECPNVFMAIEDEAVAIARDESTSSPLSIPNRGREIWKQESGCDLANNETLAEYAKRMLRDSQKVELSAEYDRRFFPDVVPGDLIRLRYPEQSLDGLFVVENQDIEIGYGARTSEEVFKR